MRFFRTPIIRWLVPCALTLLAGNSWSSHPNASEPLEEGEVTEYLAPPDSAKEEPPPPKRHLHRIAFLNIASLAAVQSHTIPLSVEYEYLGGKRSSLFVGVSHDFGAGDDDLKTGITFGQRWYFARDHGGPFLGITPLFAIGPDKGPILLTVLGSGGYIQRLWTSPWFLSGQAGFGPGIYWYETPRYDPGSGKSETNRGVIAVDLGLALGVRF